MSQQNPGAPGQSARSTTTHTFEQVFREHYPGLCRYAYVITKARDVAEEVVNDVFLKYWTIRETVQIRSSVKAFLVTATRNQAIDRLRKSTRQCHRWGELTGDFKGNYALPHDIVVAEETDRLIEAAIETLPPRGKQIFRMSRDRNMSYGEIAWTLALSVKTVEAHMGRSLKYLKAELRKQDVLN